MELHLKRPGIPGLETYHSWPANLGIRYPVNRPNKNNNGLHGLGFENAVQELWVHKMSRKFG